MQPLEPTPELPPESVTPAPAPPPTAEASLPDDRAVASIILGVLSVVGCLAWLGLPLGVPAVVLGARAHRDIRRSGGARKGYGLATAGIVLGSIGSTLFFTWLGVVSLAIVRGTAERGSMAPVPSASVAEALTETGALDQRVVALPAPPGASPRFVDLHPSTASLGSQLAVQAAAARRSGETLLLETTAQRCGPCAEVAAAATDARVQQALAKVRLLRIDVAEFRDELRALRMNEPTVPWFYLIDARGRPSDAISADEWDDNDASNIAPVLGAFVRGTLRSRRQSWRGETAL